jgi:CRP-like cAMP-binding protein
MKAPLATHPLRNSIGLQLKSNPVLAGLDDAAYAELFAMLAVHEAQRGERLQEQGGHEARQFFVVEGLLKRVATSPEGREVTLHFAGERDMETCYESWRHGCSPSFAIVCGKRALVAWLPMEEWEAFMGRHPRARQLFHDRLLKIGAAIVEHAVALLLLDAPSRVNRFSFRHPDLAQQLSQRDVASHLNLSAETLCRLVRRHRGELQQA